MHRLSHLAVGVNFDQTLNHVYVTLKPVTDQTLRHRCSSFYCSAKSRVKLLTDDRRACIEINTGSAISTAHEFLSLYTPATESKLSTSVSVSADTLKGMALRPIPGSS